MRPFDSAVSVLSLRTTVFRCGVRTKSSASIDDGYKFSISGQSVDGGKHGRFAGVLLSVMNALLRPQYLENGDIIPNTSVSAVNEYVQPGHAKAEVVGTRSKSVISASG